MTATDTRIVVDMTDLNGHDYIAIEQVTGRPLTEVLPTAAGIYAAAWRSRLKVDPSATYDNTLDLPMSAFEVINQDDKAGKANASNGVTPPPSLASGG